MATAVPAEVAGPVKNDGKKHFTHSHIRIGYGYVKITENIGVWD